MSQLPDGHRLVTIADAPELWWPFDELCSSVWPEFMLHDPVANSCWDRLRTDWPEFQIALLDAAGRVVGGANAAPIVWDGTDEDLPEGWDAQFERSVSDLAAERKPGTLGALQIVVAPDRRGQGLSTIVLEAMRRSAAGASLANVIACVRPTAKTAYPLMSIEDYAAWTRNDGLPFDPWLRVHARMGARLVRSSPQSMVISSSVDQWRKWTGMEFPVSGPYVVEGALEPVTIDLSADLGIYHDANVWMVHEAA